MYRTAIQSKQASVPQDRYWFDALLMFGRYSSLIIGLGLFPCGYLMGSWNVMLSGVLFLFVSNLLYGFNRVSNRVIFLFFHLAFFTFLLSRPTISMFRGDVWWYFDRDAVLYALFSLFLTLIFMRLGACVGDQVLKRYRVSEWKTTIADGYQLGFQKNLQMVALLFFVCTISCTLLLGIEKVFFAHQYGYEAIYLSFSSRYPYFVTTLSSMSKYALCLFLATFPPKHLAFWPLAIFFISNIPSLLTGVRNPIVLAAIFIVIYYLFRDILGDRKPWLGRVEKTLLILMIPLAILFLGAYNYIRAGSDSTLNIWETFVDFFYKQGTSFDTLCKGYQAIPQLPDVIDKNYTFGPFHEYFFHGSFAQKLGALNLGTQNSELRAIYGSNLSHSLSYVVHSGYLSGQGVGSSYLLETFVDWGYGGIIVFSFLFGLGFVLMLLWLRRGILTRSIVLVSLLNLFFIPRAETTGWLLFLVTMQFWITVVFCYLVAGVCTKRYSSCGIWGYYPTNRELEKDGRKQYV